MKNITQNELTTVLALLEWAGTQKDLLKKLEKTQTVMAITKPPADPKAKAKGKKKPAKVVKSPLTAAAFGKKVTNALKQAHVVAKHDELLSKGMAIKEWLQTGEFDGSAATTKELIEEASGMLDSACAADIVGTNLFRGSDGRLYTATVELEIGEASDEFAADILQQIQDDENDAELDREERQAVAAVDAHTADAVAKAGEPKVEVVVSVGVPLSPPHQEGKPLVEVLDTTGIDVPKFDPPKSEIAELLDRVEQQAVAGADRIAKDRARLIRATAATSLGQEVGTVEDDDIVKAWEKYKGWKLPDLDKELGIVTRTEDTAEEVDAITVVAALRRHGIDSVGVLYEDQGILNTNAVKARSEQAAVVAGIALERPVGPEELNAAMDEYGDWEPVALRDHFKKLTKKLDYSGGLGEDTRDEYTQVSIVVAVRNWLASEEGKTDVGVPESGVGESRPAE